MRSFLLGLVILAAPAYAAGQQGENRDRSATGRTAVLREGGPQASPNRENERRGGEHREGPSTDGSARERFRSQPPHVAPAPSRWTNRPAIPPSRSSIPVPNIGPRPFPNLTHRGLVPTGGDYRPRYRRPHSRPSVVFVPYASPVVVEREVIIEREVVDEAASAPVIAAPPLLARLILDIHPPTAQVFADGYYIGIPEDFRFEEGGAVLEPGPHRIEIRARDYEPVSFDVNLARGQSATFRHSLTPMRPASQPAPDNTANTPQAAKKPTTFYLIRGCYMGNVPPKEANLPATCDIARAVSFQY
jgi:hypothetical protein